MQGLKMGLETPEEPKSEMNSVVLRKNNPKEQLKFSIEV
jgi:hypothetical protein